MSLDLKSKLKKNNVTVIVVPNATYTKSMISIVKQLSSINENICLININMMSDVLMNLFDKKGINYKKFLFIDALTKSTKTKPKERDNCIYVESPYALTSFNRTIKTAMKTGKLDALFFDNLSTLLLYSQNRQVLRFTKDIIDFIKENNQKAILLALIEDVKKGMLNDVGMWVDEMIDINGDALEIETEIKVSKSKGKVSAKKILKSGLIEKN